MVTEMYALPAYRGIDPNPLIFWFFLFFFGFMFADVAYGIIIWAVSFIIWKSYKPKGTMGYMFRLGQYMGISTFICGVFTGGFFGDVIPKVAEQMFGIPLEGLPQWLQAFSNGIIVNPINDPMTTLILAVVIGVVQLVFGQCIHIYMGFRDGTAVDSLLDVVPWWLFFASIGLVVAGQPWWWILVGCVILIATQGHTKRGFFGKLLGGVASLYDVTSWLSDILSYSRLMALMLSGSVIAQVFNTLGAIPGNVVVFFIVSMAGNALNFALNLLFHYIGVERLSGTVLNRPVLGELILALFGLIPNCSVSVVVTESYLSGVLGLGGLFAGLLSNAGIGLLVLLRTNRNWKENAAVVAILYGFSVLAGIAVTLLAG